LPERSVRAQETGDSPDGQRQQELGEFEGQDQDPESHRDSRSAAVVRLPGGVCQPQWLALRIVGLVGVRGDMWRG